MRQGLLSLLLCALLGVSATAVAQDLAPRRLNDFAAVSSFGSLEVQSSHNPSTGAPNFIVSAAREGRMGRCIIDFPALVPASLDQAPNVANTAAAATGFRPPTLVVNRPTVRIFVSETRDAVISWVFTLLRGRVRHATKTCEPEGHRLVTLRLDRD